MYRVLLAGIVAVALVLRFYDLGSWPPYVDEGSYTKCAIDAQLLPTLTAIVSIGNACWKPPLVILAQMWLLPWLSDEFAAGRAVSAASGGALTILTGLLGYRVGGRWCGLLSTALYAVAPLAVLHERQVLQDGPMSALTLGAVLLVWSAAERSSVPLGLLAALAGAMAALCKVTAILVTPVEMLAVGAAWWAHRACVPWRSVRGWLAVITPIGTPILVYEMLWLTPVSVGMRAQNDMQLLNDQRAVDPLVFVGGNLLTAGDMMATYFSGGLWLVILVGLGLLAWRAPARALFMLAGSTVQVAPLIVLSNYFPSHYAQPSIPFWCVLIGYTGSALVCAARAYGRVAVVGAAGVISLYLVMLLGQSVRLVVDFDHAPLSFSDNKGYRGMGSSYGYREGAAFIRSQIEPGSYVAYALGHPLFAPVARMSHPLPPGTLSLGVIDSTDTVPTLPGAVYVLVGPSYMSGQAPRLADREFTRQNPQAVELQRFLRPNSDEGVTVYRLPPSARTERVPVVLQWPWPNGTWGWSPVVVSGDHWSRSTASDNSVTFATISDGGISAGGTVASSAAPVEIDVLLDGKLLERVLVTTPGPVSLGAGVLTMPAGRHQVTVRGHAVGQPDGPRLPVTISDLTLSTPHSPSGASASERVIPTRLRTTRHRVPSPSPDRNPAVRVRSQVASTEHLGLRARSGAYRP